MTNSMKSLSCLGESLKIVLYLQKLECEACTHSLFISCIFTDQKLTSQVHEIVGRINGRFGTLTTVPIHHLVRS